MNITDGPADIYTNVTRRARKAHTCSACGEQIRPQQRYTLTTVIMDRAVETSKRCARCEAIHAHLRDRADVQDEWPDERLGCGDSYEDVFDEPPPLEIEALAFALPGEVTL